MHCLFYFSRCVLHPLTGYVGHLYEQKLIVIWSHQMTHILFDCYSFVISVSDVILTPQIKDGRRSRECSGAKTFIVVLALMPD